MRINRIAMGLTILILLVMFIRWQLRTQPQVTSILPLTNETAASQSSNGLASMPAAHLLSGQQSPLAATNEPDPHMAEVVRKFTEEIKADPSYQFNVPILFYGKVLDQDEEPVTEANIHIEWNKLKSSNEIERAIVETKSDERGLFSLEGQRGGRLFVTPSKEGYYNVPTNLSFFEYADPGNDSFYTPDVKNPVVFHLRKKGHGVALVTSANGMRTNVKLSIPMDGTPISVDLMNQKAAPAGPLQVSQVKPINLRPEEATEWSFRMAIPDGGFVEHHDEFPFEAPEAGYQPTVEFAFNRNQATWTDGIKKDYYFRFGNPPVYGRLHLETSITEAGARLTYAINPDGTRNLEPAN